MSNPVKIVLPTDFSEASMAALDWARKMAAQLDAELHVITIVQSPVIFQPTVSVSYPTLEDLRGEGMKRLKAFEKEHLGGLDQKTELAVMTGRASDEIVRYAEETDATMIVMATHGHSGLAHIIIGSTTENVVRHATCPVLSIRK